MDLEIQTLPGNDKEQAPNQHEILKKRAALLSKVENEVDTKQQQLIEIVEFQLEKDLYGIETQYVKEVCHYNKFAPIPIAIAHTIGLVNSRGQIFSLVDLKSIFGVSSHESHQDVNVIILNNKEICIGLVVDKVVGIGWYHRRETQTANDIFGENMLAYIKEVTINKVGIINMDKIYETGVVI